MTVSVAMATFQGSAYVLEQLRSVVEQSLPPAEVVVCDDGSTDGTVRLVAGFAETSAVPIRLVVNDERLGWRANFMKAASLCRSELIAFCDQDDVWDRRKVEVVVDAFARTDALMVFHDAVIAGGDLQPIRPFEQGGGEPDRAAALGRGPWRDVYGFTIAFRRDLLALWSYWPSSEDKSVGGQPAAHDQWLLFLGSALGTTLHLPERLAWYRQHTANAVGVKDAFRPPSRIQALLTYRDAVNLRLDVLDTRIRILRGIAQDQPRFGPAAASALRTYESYRDRIARQTVVWNSDGLRERLPPFLRLLRSGAYGRDVWALGRTQALDDGLAVLLGPPGLARLRRLVRRRSATRPR